MQDVNKLLCGQDRTGLPGSHSPMVAGRGEEAGSRCGRAVKPDSKGAATRVSRPTVRQFAAGRYPYGSFSGSSSRNSLLPSPCQQRPFRGIRGSSPTRMAGGGAGVIGVGRDRSRSYVAGALLHALPGSGAPRRVASGGENTQMVRLVEASSRHRRIASHTPWQGGGQPPDV
jgi:hypothetical protein